ncbi:MAG: hypothetical protein WC408_06480 [Candidatus Micrarchaeia archaeon]
MAESDIPTTVSEPQRKPKIVSVSQPQQPAVPGAANVASPILPEVLPVQTSVVANKTTTNAVVLQPPTASKLTTTTVNAPAAPFLVSSVQTPTTPPARPRILSQVTGVPVPTQRPVSITGVSAGVQAKPEPATDADWAEQTLAQAEQDSEEARMAHDVTSTFVAPLPAKQDNQTEASKPPKSEPKSVPGLLYTIKGWFGGAAKKLTGK